MRILSMIPPFSPLISVVRSTGAEGSSSGQGNLNACVEHHELVSCSSGCRKFQQQINICYPIFSFVIDALDRIATEATRMAHYDRRKTVTLRDMEFSCRLCLPDIMAKHANQKAQKTVTKFYAAKVRDRMRRTEMRRGEFAMMQMAAM